MLLEISQNSQENTCIRIFFLIKLQDYACNFIKKEALSQCFPVNFVKFVKTPFLQNTSERLLLTLLMTWEDCFNKPKLLLAANRLIYLNISCISKIHRPPLHSFLHKLPLEKLPPGSLVHHSFLHSKTASGETSSRYLFQDCMPCECNYYLRK